MCDSKYNFEIIRPSEFKYNCFLVRLWWKKKKPCCTNQNNLVSFLQQSDGWSRSRAYLQPGVCHGL